MRQGKGKSGDERLTDGRVSQVCKEFLQTETISISQKFDEMHLY